MKAYQLKEFELSQAYLFYWDKIEKSNWFYEQIIATADEDLSGRLVQKLLEDPVTDGGQWDMVANLVQKYGLVPHSLYPDNYNAQNSSKLNWLLTAKLREHALILRKLAAKKGDDHAAHTLAISKDRFLKEIHSIVTMLLGPLQTLIRNSTGSTMIQTERPGSCERLHWSSASRHSDLKPGFPHAAAPLCPQDGFLVSSTIQEMNITGY